MGASSLQDVKDCLGDPSRIKVVPLLTFFFLQEDKTGAGDDEPENANQSAHEKPAKKK